MKTRLDSSSSRGLLSNLPCGGVKAQGSSRLDIMTFSKLVSALDRPNAT